MTPFKLTLKVQSVRKLLLKKQLVNLWMDSKFFFSFLVVEIKIVGSF